MHAQRYSLYVKSCWYKVWFLHLVQQVFAAIEAQRAFPERVRPICSQHQPGHLSRLLHDGCCGLVSRGELIHKTDAFSVEEDGPTPTQLFRGQPLQQSSGMSTSTFQPLLPALCFPK